MGAREEERRGEGVDEKERVRRGEKGEGGSGR